MNEQLQQRLPAGLIDRYLKSRPEWQQAEGLCVYGSYYNGRWIPDQSDVDLMRLENGVTEMKRTNDRFEGTEFNTYTLSLKVLEDDVRDEKYGFWYINRFLTPHHFVIDRNGFQEKITQLVSEFLDQYAFPEVFVDERGLTLEQIIARVYLIQLNDFPHYAVGFLSIFQQLDFVRLREQFARYIAASPNISQRDNVYTYLKPNSVGNRALYHERIRLRRWDAHRQSRRDGSDSDFVSKYLVPIEKTAHANQSEIQALMHFLHEQAGLDYAASK